MATTGPRCCSTRSLMVPPLACPSVYVMRKSLNISSTLALARMTSPIRPPNGRGEYMEQCGVGRLLWIRLGAEPGRECAARAALGCHGGGGDFVLMLMMTVSVTGRQLFRP